MYRSRLIPRLSLLLLGAVVACKENAPAPSTAESKSAQTARVRLVPAEKVYAASSHVRVIDPASGLVTGRIDLQRSVTSFAFTRDGKRAFASASDGVYEFDVAGDKLLGRITDHPARKVVVDDAAQRLWVLEHDVVVKQDGQRDVQPFRLAGVDLATGKVVYEEEIGQRIAFAMPSSDTRRNNIVVGDSGVVTVGSGKLAEGTPLELRGLFAPDGPFRVRGEATAVFGTHAYVPVESARSRIADIDLVSGRVAWIDFGRQVQFRAVAPSKDGKLLYVNAAQELIAIDLATHAPRAAIELPGGHMGLAMSSDGTWAFLAKTIHEGGGGVTVVDLDALAVRATLPVSDISPWAIGVLPR